MTARRLLPALVAVALLGLAGGADAQVLGISVGRTSSGVDWVYPRPSDPAPGQIVGASSNTDRRSFSVAGTVRWDVREWLAVRTGGRLVPKGYDVTSPTFHMLYLEAPLAAMLQSGTGSAFFVEGGVSPGIRLECRRFTRSHEDDCGDTTMSHGRELDGLRRWELSWILGSGVRFGGRGRWIVAEVRAQRSLIDIQPDETPIRTVNRVFSFSVGVEWTLSPPPTPPPPASPP